MWIETYPYDETIAVIDVSSGRKAGCGLKPHHEVMSEKATDVSSGLKAGCGLKLS